MKKIIFAAVAFGVVSYPFWGAAFAGQSTVEAAGGYRLTAAQQSFASACETSFSTRGLNIASGASVGVSCACMADQLKQEGVKTTDLDGYMQAHKALALMLEARGVTRDQGQAKLLQVMTAPLGQQTIRAFKAC